MLGSFGLHLGFILFPATDKEGRATVDPTKEGAFVVHVGEVEVRYKLPLGSFAASRDRSENRRVVSGQLPFQSIHWHQAFPRACWRRDPPTRYPQQPLAALARIPER
jgi:hypothetical protein